MPRIKSQAVIKNNAIESNKNYSNNSTSIFTLFSREKHDVNWYVHRNKSIRTKLKQLWGDGPDNKKDLASMNADQETMTRVNALFRALETNGPISKNIPFQIKVDGKHGSCNRPKENCISKGFYHTHVTDSLNSYLVMWECFEDKKLINIVAIGLHENFDFKQKGHDSLFGMKCAMDAAKKFNFYCTQEDAAKHYNNKIYDN
jgi:hypothetical protein